MFNEEGYCFIGKNGIIELTMFETKFLTLLFKNKHKVTTYKEICKEIYDQEEDYYYKEAIQVKVSRLRNKLKNEINIKSKTGLGYRID